MFMRLGTAKYFCFFSYYALRDIINDLLVQRLLSIFCTLPVIMKYMTVNLCVFFLFFSFFLFFFNTF